MGEGVAPPGVPAGVVPPRERVPEREPPEIALSTDLDLPAASFQLGEIVKVGKIRFFRLAGIGFVNQHRGTLLYGHLFNIMRGGIIHLVRDGNTQITTTFIIRYSNTCRSVRKGIPAQTLSVPGCI